MPPLTSSRPGTARTSRNRSNAAPSNGSRQLRRSSTTPGVRGPAPLDRELAPFERHPHLAWGRGEDVSDRVVELADAVKTGSKGRIREGQAVDSIREPGRVRSLSPCESDWAGAHLLSQESPKMTIAEVQARAEPGDPFAVDGAVCDQTHGAGDDVGAPVPLW